MSTYDTLLVSTAHDGEVVHVTLNQPQTRNALSRVMMRELGALTDRLEREQRARVLVLRGAGGTFCAGGNIADFDAHRQSVVTPGEPDPIAQVNRASGALFARIRRLPLVLVAAIEGAALGGGMGLACIVDVALATADARLGMTETTLGVVPAQISPFVAERIGVSQCRRLALTGERLDGHEALRIGLVHRVVESSAALDAAVANVVAGVLRCAPAANRLTKEVFLASGTLPLEQHLDMAAERFAQSLRSSEGEEGVRAFLAKRAPAWVRK